MKYFINGEKVRESKRIYTHAVVNVNGTLIGCCGSYELACNLMNREKAIKQGNIESYRSAIRALENGESHYWVKDGRGRQYRCSAGCTKEEYEAGILEFEKYRDGYRIVELEARE